MDLIPAPASPDQASTAPGRMPFYRRKGFQLAVSVLMLAALATNIEWKSVGEFILLADPLMLALLALFIPLGRIFMAWKWRLLVIAQGGRISLWESIRIYLLSNLTGTVLPLGGVGPDVVRVSLLSQAGMPTSISVPSIMVERVVGVVATMIMFATGLFLGVTLLGGEHFPVGHLYMVAIVIATALLVVSGGFWVRARGHHWADAQAPAFVRRLGLARHWEVFAGYAGHKRLLALSVILAWIEQWSSVITFFITCRAFDLPLSFLACAAIMPVASILERLPISTAGIGIKEAGIVYMAGLFGVPLAEAFIVSMASRIVYLVTLLALNLLVLIIRPRRIAAADA